MLSANLKRLGLEAEPPSVAALFRLHRAQVERIPYETTWIHLGEQWNIDVDASMERIAFRGRGGYCFHLNGSFARVLMQLGYDVSLHVGGVHRGEPAAEFMTNHLVLLVDGLPTDDNPSGTWYVARIGLSAHRDRAASKTQRDQCAARADFDEPQRRGSHITSGVRQSHVVHPSQRRIPFAYRQCRSAGA